jgi:hypothetical protein
VDLDVEQFDLLQARSVEGLCLAKDFKDPIVLARAFWPAIVATEGTPAACFKEQDKQLLRNIFNPRLSDRRQEGDLFQPPATAVSYVDELRNLLQQEDEVRQKRKKHFLSESFDPACAGQAFPSSWTTTFEVARQGEDPQSNGKPRCGGDILMPCSPGECHTSLEELRSCSLIFDKSTEDGIRFRIYRPGSLEVRTVQECNLEETISAAFFVHAPGGRAPLLKHLTGEGNECAQIQEDEVVTEVIIYVEGDSHTGPSYLLVIKTAQCHAVVTQLTKNGTIVWDENPLNLTTRCSHAKALYAWTASGECTSVKALKEYAESLQATEAVCQADPGATLEIAEAARRRFTFKLYRHASGQHPQPLVGMRVQMGGETAIISDGEKYSPTPLLDEIPRASRPN